VEQRLRLYRNHTPGCVHGYTKPVFEGDSAPDCSCPINAQGYLRNVVDEKGKPVRILHRSLGTRNQPVKDWNEARIIRDQWLEWGQTTAPNVNLEHSNVTVAQAAQFWFQFEQTDVKSRPTRGKYDIFLNKRLLPWCQATRKLMMKDFDNAVTVKNFYMSWRNLQPERGKGIVLTSDVRLSVNTRVHELERYRTFLEFAKNNGWLKTNFAKSPYIKLKPQKVQWKYPFLESEWERIRIVLDEWHDRYYKSNPGRKERLKAFVYALRWFGQRLSDTTMLGPHSISVDDDGKRFIELTQIKTGSAVKIPLPDDLHDMLVSLPILGQTSDLLSII
jgi:integrase